MRIYTKRIKMIIPIIICIVVISLILVYTFYSEIYYLLAKDPTNNEGLCFFYNILNPNLHFWLTTFIYSIPSLIILNDIMNNHFNKFDYFIKERIGAQKNILRNYLSTFIRSFLFCICIYLYILIFIHTILTPINFSYSEYVEITNFSINIFSKNTFINLLIYILFSSLGFSVFNILVLSIKNRFKQKYLFKISSLVIGIVMSVIPVIVSSSLYSFFKYEFLLKIGSIVLLPSLMTPGIQGFGSYGSIINPFVNYIGSFLAYGLLALVIIYIEYKGEYKYDY